MRIVWRIASDTPVYGSDDTSGKGAELTGGRWNRKGTPLIYTSESIALACLETVVHLGGVFPLPLNRYLVKIVIPDDTWTSRTIFNASAHVGWDALPPGLVSIDWGSRWASSGVSALAQVPSAIVPEEFNILINPRHASAAGIEASKIRRWTYDVRVRS